MPLKRNEVEDYVKNYWYQPCDDKVIYHGDIKPEVEKNKLWPILRQIEPDREGWQPVFLPLPPSGEEREEHACFICRAPDGAARVEVDPLKVPPELKQWATNHPDVGKPTPVDATLWKVPQELQGNFYIAEFHPDKGLEDCSHFVSRALHRGKVEVTGPPRRWSASWGTAPTPRRWVWRSM